MAVHNEMFVLFPLPFTAFMSVGTDVIIKPHSIYSRIREHCGIGRGAETGEFIHRDFMIRTWNNPDMAYENFCRRRTECSGISVRVRKAGDMKKTTKAKMIIAAFLAAVMFLSACGASAPGGSQKQGSQETETQKPKSAVEPSEQGESVNSAEYFGKAGEGQTGLNSEAASERETGKQPETASEGGTEAQSETADESAAMESEVQMTKGLKWWQKTNVCEIYIRSFNDTDGDGIGDLNGITEKLDYLKKMGIGAIWLTPCYKSPQADNGYDIADYYEIDETFGTMEDMDRLIAEAGKRDIRIVMDLVFNHTSDQNSWFIESASGKDNPKSDWYIWRDAKPDGGPPTNWRGIFGLY